MKEETAYPDLISPYIHPRAINLITEWLSTTGVDFKIKKSRSTKLGDFKPPINGSPSRITVNNDLNQHSFLITLVHELAHYNTWEKYQNKVKPHGSEWKVEFTSLMMPFLNMPVFPMDVYEALEIYMDNPKASSCTDIRLMKVLRKYDEQTEKLHLEDLPDNATFKIKKGRIFIKGEKIRKRYRCKEIKNNRIYLFSPVAEVTIVANNV